MTFETKLSEDQKYVNVRTTWKIPVNNTMGRELTEGQIDAIRDYCEQFVLKDLQEASITRSIIITPCQILRYGEHESSYYDADTGELYTEAEIFDGYHEIRIKPVKASEIA